MQPLRFAGRLVGLSLVFASFGLLVPTAAHAAATVEVWRFWATEEPQLIVRNAAACSLSPDETMPPLEVTIDGRVTLYKPPPGRHDVAYVGPDSFVAGLADLIAPATLPNLSNGRHSVSVRCGGPDLVEVGGWSDTLAPANELQSYPLVTNRMVFFRADLPCAQPIAVIDGQIVDGEWTFTRDGVIEESNFNASEPAAVQPAWMHTLELRCAGKPSIGYVDYEGPVLGQDYPKFPSIVAVAPESWAPVLSAIPTPAEVARDPMKIAVSVVVAVVATVVLVGFPSSIVNKTIKNNWLEINNWFSKLRRRRSEAAWNSPRRLGVMTLFQFAAVAATLATFADISARLNLETVIVLLGLTVAVAAIAVTFTAVKDGIVLISLRRRPRFVVSRFGLAMAFTLAVFSRLASFVPGYVYGLVGTWNPKSAEPNARSASPGVSAFAVLVGTLATFGLSLYAFGELADYREAASAADAPFVLRLAYAIWAGIFIYGVETVVFGLLPLRGMDGGSLCEWSKAVWFAVYVLGFGFYLHVLILHRDAAVLDPGQLPIPAKAAVLFGVFLIFSMAFRGWFSIKRRPGQLYSAFAQPTMPDL